jgi:hypothetical protein
MDLAPRPKGREHKCRKDAAPRRPPSRWRWATVCIVAATMSAECSPELGGSNYNASYAPISTVLASSFRLRSTSDWLERSPLIGHWTSQSADLIVVPRRAPEADGSGLFVVIPSGSYEGVLWLPDQHTETWRGSYIDARRLEQSAASVRHDPSSDTLQWQRFDGTLSFRRIGPVNLTLLQEISIIGHRGLSLGRKDLMNTLRGIQLSWLFACSGVELDVAVPHDSERTPLPDELRIYHPEEWRSEIFGDDAVSLDTVKAALTPQRALSAARQAGIGFVYFDPKLRWLMARSQRRAVAVASLNRLLKIAGSTADPITQTIAIGTETSDPGEAADMISQLRARDGWPAHILWALELTRGTNLQSAEARFRSLDVARRPELLSVNLLRVRSGGGGLLRLFVSTIPDSMERSFMALEQPVIYWTAHDADQFAAAVDHIVTMKRGTSRAAGIITPFPHRLAFYLGTRSTP